MTLGLFLTQLLNGVQLGVLLFLLSMMAHQQSRARMLAVGGIFVLFSGLMYFAFMAAWLNLFQLLGELAWVTLAAGLLAVVVGAVNVKDFFLFDRGVSLSIPESRKPDIFRRARAILAAENLPAMLAATVFLAVAANFYELLCTAGFPMVYTRLLTLGEPSAAVRYLYLALYNLVYVLPLAAIVLVFARTLVTKPDNWLVTVGLQSFVGEYLVEWPALMAAGVVSLIPMLVLFLLLEPFLVSGMTSGAVKQ